MLGAWNSLRGNILKEFKEETLISYVSIRRRFASMPVSCSTNTSVILVKYNILGVKAIVL